MCFRTACNTPITNYTTNRLDYVTGRPTVSFMPLLKAAIALCFKQSEGIRQKGLTMEMEKSERIQSVSDRAIWLAFCQL